MGLGIFIQFVMKQLFLLIECTESDLRQGAKNVTVMGFRVEKVIQNTA